MAITGFYGPAVYTGNGATVMFATGWKFATNADVKVTKTPSGSTIATTLAEGVDYTLSGAGSDVGGTVTTTLTPASGDVITITRSTPKTQPTAFRTQGGFSPWTHETSLDRGAMISQELDVRIGVLEASQATAQAIPPFSAVTFTHGAGGGGTAPTLVVTGTPPVDAVHSFEVQATSAAAVGTATFEWREDGGSWTTGLTTATTPTQLGTTGVSVAWPAGGSFASGDDYLFTSNPVPSSVAQTNKAQTFTQTQTLNGGGDLAAARKTTIAPSGFRKLVDQWETGAGTLRFYASAVNAGLEITLNAYIDPNSGNWTADSPGVSASKWVFSSGSAGPISVRSKASTVSGWVDSGWDAIDHNVSADFSPANGTVSGSAQLVNKTVVANVRFTATAGIGANFTLFVLPWAPPNTFYVSAVRNSAGVLSIAPAQVSASGGAVGLPGTALLSADTVDFSLSFRLFN